MDVAEITGVREPLDEFVAEVFGSLPRKEQRSKGGLYLQGLMLEGRRKSMQSVEPVRRVLARKAIGAVGPEAWVIDDTGFKKDGIASPCLARQYSGMLGKIGNCQIGVSVNAVTDFASCPLGWRLFVSEGWDDTCADSNQDAAVIAARRLRAQIPDAVRHRTKWELALERSPTSGSR